MREFVRIITTAVLAVGLTLPLLAAGRTAAAEHFQRAQTLLEDLRAVPRPELGRRQYDLVIRAFETVHRTSPASGYCDDALLAVAQLYAEKHDRFGDERYRDSALKSYQFLIREYPHSSLLGQARAEMAKLEKGGKLSLSQVKNPTPTEEDLAPEPKKAPAPAPKAKPAQKVEAPSRPQPELTLTSTPSSTSAPRENRVAETPARLGSGTIAIKDLRYWSTPEYTRIAIELDDFAPFKFEFLSRPRRMYFDLLTSELQGDLVRGGNYEVGGPAVERLRIAMNRSNKARLVMDLNDEVYYDVAWLANPPRLMIELQAKSVQRQTLARNEEPETKEKAAEPAEHLSAAAEPQPEPEPEPVEVAEALPEPAPSVAGRVAQRPATFAEAFRALSGGAPVRRAAAPAPKPAEPKQSAPAPREKYVPKSRRSESPKARTAVADDAAPVINEIPASKAEPPVILAKLERPSSPAEEDLKEAAPIKIAPPKPADATSKGSQSLIRALGLKVGKVVIDAGHGGHDTGSIGPTGLLEKDVVLDVSQRLAKLIETRLGSEVLLTRDSDTFVDLSKRAPVANQAGADLFISVHANSFTNHSVRGVETYYLNFTTDPWALKVASRENAASSKTVHELQDLLSKIAMKEKIDESREFAERMQGVLYGGLSTTTKGLRNRGVRQAPLMVLIGAKMPAILAEIGFLSNPTDEKLLKSSKYRQQVAEYLYEGIESYVGSLSSHQLTMSEQERASASLD